MPARNSVALTPTEATINASFRCPACDTGVCSIPRPAMLIGGGKLRPASAGEASELAAREIVSWELTRLPGLGKEGLAKLLSSGGPAGNPEPALLITCTCGHLFLDPLSRE